jgi:hypothetical protein
VAGTSGILITDALSCGYMDVIARFVAFPNPLPCLASTFVHKTFEKAVSDAEGIVRGTIGMSYANWVKADGSQKIYTFTELHLDEVLKGDIAPSASKTLILRELGGEKDGVGLQIPGSAKFKRGQEVVVFVTLPVNSDGSFSVRGMMLGKYDLVHGDDGVSYLTGGRISFDTGGHDDTDHPKDSGTEPPKKWTLTAVRDLIRTQNLQKPQVKNGTAVTPRPDAANPAPGLQPSSQRPAEPPRSAGGFERRGETDSSFSSWFVGGALLLGLALLVAYLLRK